MISPGSGKVRCFRPLPRTCNSASASFRSSSWSARISQERRPSSNIKTDHGEIAERAKAGPELSHMLCRQGLDHAPRLLEAETEGDGAMGPPIADRAASRIGALEMGTAAGDLLTEMETIQTTNHGQAMIYGLRRRLGLLVELMADIVEQCGLGDSAERAWGWRCHQRAKWSRS